MNLEELPSYVDRMRRDVLAEALSTATADHWRRRARRLAEALPREGDFPGRCPGQTPEQRRKRVLAMISACEARAATSLPVPAWVGAPSLRTEAGSDTRSGLRPGAVA